MSGGGGRPPTVIIPAQNESPTIAAVVAGIRKAIPAAHIVVVDDASTDETGALAAAAGAEVLRHPCPLGYAEAVVTGLTRAVELVSEVIVLLDADEQHDARYIPELIETLRRSGADMVIASRDSAGGRDPRGWAGRIGNAVFAATVRVITGTWVRDTSSGFKVLRFDAVRALLSSHFVDFHAESIVFLLAARYKIVEHPVKMAPRRTGRSMHRWTSLFVYPPKTALIVFLNVLKGRKERGKAK